MTTLKEDSAKMHKATCPTIDHLVYGALRDDLKDERHVDMVFSYYNETAGRVEYSAKCHRAALAAKSRVLRHLLCHSGLEETLSLTLVGTSEMSAAEDVVAILYDPEKSGKDIALWDDASAPLPPQKEERCEEIQVKPEIDPSHEEEPAWSYTYYGKVDEEEDTKEDWNGEVWPPPLKDEEEEEDEWRPSEKKPPRRKRRTPPPRDDPPGIDVALQKTENGGGGLSLDKVARLVEEGADVVGFHDYAQKRCGRFRAVTHDGALTRFSCCKNCKAVVHCRHMHSHSKRCRIGTLNPELLHSAASEEASSPSMQGQELRAKNRLLANTIAHLLRTGSDKAERFPPTEGELPPALSDKYDCVRHEGRVVPWVVCRGCSLLVLIDSRQKFKSNPWTHLERHKCNLKTQARNRLTAPISGDLDAALLERLIDAGDPEVALKRIQTFDYVSKRIMSAKDDRNLNSFFKHVFYRESFVPFLHCRMCTRVVEEAAAATHECCTATKDLQDIYRNERARISIGEGGGVNPLYLHIAPVELDGGPTEYAFCQRCDDFLPKAVVQKGDYKHSCKRTKQPAETFKSPNLRALPRENSKSIRFECLLCGELLPTAHCKF